MEQTIISQKDIISSDQINGTVNDPANTDAVKEISVTIEKEIHTPQQHAQQVKNKFTGNILHEENLGFIPGTFKGKQDFTNKDILQVLKEADIFKYLTLLQISNKSIDVMVHTKDVTDF